VAAAYRRQGMMLSFSEPRGEWPTLVMRKRRTTEAKPLRRSQARKA
jgi:hypothetical protein